MTNSILLVEDNSHKLDRVKAFINEIAPHLALTEAHSFSSGCKLALDQNYELVILDISLPTYDKVANETGGRNRPFGGREIARKLIRRNLNSKIVFLTQFDSFSDKGRSHSLETLTELLKKECGEKFVGLIHYDSSRSAWKEELLDLLNKAFFFDENINS